MTRYVGQGPTEQPAPPAASVEIPEAALVKATEAVKNRMLESGSFGDAAQEAIEAALPYLAPAGDGGLREALEQALESPVELWHENSFRVRALPETVLRELLAAHPAAPAVPQPAEMQASDDEPKSLTVHLTGPGAAFVSGTAFPSGVAYPAVPQPVDREALTREQIKQALCSADGPIDTRSADVRSVVLEQTYGKYADAVLAVLAGEQEQVES